jgi:hypothetical protein
MLMLTTAMQPCGSCSPRRPPWVMQTPVRSYLKLAPLECGLALAADIMFTFRTSSPPALPPLSRIAVLALFYAVCGFALPATLLSFSTLQCR